MMCYFILLYVRRFWCRSLLEKMLNGFEAQKAVRRIDNCSSFDGGVDSSMESLGIQSEEKGDLVSRGMKIFNLLDL